jgi:hypothetical protein
MRTTCQKYYLNLEEDPESNDKNEDYKASSPCLLDRIEESFHWLIPTFFLPSPALSMLTSLT